MLKCTVLRYPIIKLYQIKYILHRVRRIENYSESHTFTLPCAEGHRFERIDEFCFFVT